MDDLSLFGDDPAPAPDAATRPKLAERWQTDLIRKALDAQGFATQGERGAKVMALAGRPVAGLADLTSDEAARVLIELGKTRMTDASNASLWESREEDTWIDRL